MGVIILESGGRKHENKNTGKQWVSKSVVRKWDAEERGNMRIFLYEECYNGNHIIYKEYTNWIEPFSLQRDQTTCVSWGIITIKTKFLA